MRMCQNLHVLSSEKTHLSKMVTLSSVLIYLKHKFDFASIAQPWLAYEVPAYFYVDFPNSLICFLQLLTLFSVAGESD